MVVLRFKKVLGLSNDILNSQISGSVITHNISSDEVFDIEVNSGDSVDLIEYLESLQFQLIDTDPSVALDGYEVHTATQITYDNSISGLSDNLQDAIDELAAGNFNITDQEQGSILYYDGLDWSQLGPATDGYVLHTRGTLADPEWAGVSLLFDTLDADNNNIENVKTVTFNEIDDGYGGTADTIDWDSGQKHSSILNDNVTFTFNPPAGACNLLLKIQQDDTGNRTVTWPASVLWPDGTEPTLSTSGGAIDIITFYYDETNYYGTATLNFL